MACKQNMNGSVLLNCTRKSVSFVRESEDRKIVGGFFTIHAKATKGPFFFLPEGSTL